MDTTSKSESLQFWSSWVPHARLASFRMIFWEPLELVRRPLAYIILLPNVAFVSSEVRCHGDMVSARFYRVWDRNVTTGSAVSSLASRQKRSSSAGLRFIWCSASSGPGRPRQPESPGCLHVGGRRGKVRARTAERPRNSFSHMAAGSQFL